MDGLTAVACRAADVIVELDPDAPLPPYEQLREQIVGMIVAGTLAPGTRLPPIRQLATDLSLAPGTVARTYRELESSGFVETRGRRGTRVAPAERWTDTADPTARLSSAARRYANVARQLGVTPGDAVDEVARQFDDLDRVPAEEP